MQQHERLSVTVLFVEDLLSAVFKRAQIFPFLLAKSAAAKPPSISTDRATSVWKELPPVWGFVCSSAAFGVSALFEPPVFPEEPGSSLTSPPPAGPLGSTGSPGSPGLPGSSLPHSVNQANPALFSAFSIWERSVTVVSGPCSPTRTSMLSATRIVYS